MKLRPLLPPIAAALLLAAGCSRHQESAAAPELPTASVRTAVAKFAEQPFFTEITGTVRPMNRAQIAAKVMGTISEMPVVLGQRVKTGDLLVQISAGEIAARRAQAQAQLSQVRRDLDRERSLLSKNASTADMVRNLEDRLAMTEAMVREADVMLGYATLRAPFDGVVAQTLAREGDLAAPGQPLVSLEGGDNFQVEASIPESIAATLKTDAPLMVELPSRGVIINGRLTELSSAADPMARTVPAKIAVPAEAGVRSGEFVRVRLPGAPTAAIVVPFSAVSMIGQMERVFVVQNHRAVLRLVKTGARHGDEVEILSGLAGGESVVLAAPAGLRDGQPVVIQP